MTTDDFKNTLRLAKKLANLILAGKKIKNSHTKDLLDNQYQTYLTENLSDKKLIEQRDILRKQLEEEKNKKWENLWAIVVPQKRFHYLKSFGKIAALFLGILCLAYFYKNIGIFNKSEPLDDMTNSDITLKLENGEVLVLKPTGEKKIIGHKGQVIGSKKGGEINYVSSQKHNTRILGDEVLMYNELKIPYGRTFQLVLSDGTEVYLNSGTTLKYPIKFIGAGKRQVYLDGEAYFEVSKDAEHPFVVHSNDLDIRVLGTKFVVSSYPEDSEINTILVEGSVGLSKNGQEFSTEHSTVLVPDQKASWNKKERTISIEKVDTNNFTGWVNGKLIFDEMPFQSILKILERHYNVSITNNNKSLGEKKFTARFDSETIDQVLTAFAMNYAFEFKIENRKIIIN